MTGFRLAQNLPAYSGGTVRDLHPVFYSPVGLLPLPQVLKRNIYLQVQYTQLFSDCQWKSKAEKPPKLRCGFHFKQQYFVFFIGLFSKLHYVNG